MLSGMKSNPRREIEMAKKPTTTAPTTTAPANTAKVFMSGTSQAVRLPRAYRFDCETVTIRRDGDSLVLTPVPTTWDDLRAEGEGLSDDFIAAALDDSDLLALEDRESFD